MKSNIIPMHPETTDPLSVRRLQAQGVSIRLSDHATLECEIAGDRLYRGVSAVLLFPISHPGRWVSLRFTDEEDKEREIGVIEDLSEFPQQAQQLLQESLTRHYHELRIERVLSVKQKFGQLFFRVGTTRGEVEFVTPWRQDRAEDWGENGKVILDALNNRYLIPDVQALSAKEQRLLRTYIYW